MRFRFIVSYRTSRSKTISTWRNSVQGRDLASATANIIENLKRRQRRPLTVIGIYVQLQEATATP